MFIVVVRITSRLLLVIWIKERTMKTNRRRGDFQPSLLLWQALIQALLTQTSILR